MSNENDTVETPVTMTEGMSNTTMPHQAPAVAADAVAEVEATGVAATVEGPSDAPPVAVKPVSKKAARKAKAPKVAVVDAIAAYAHSRVEAAREAAEALEAITEPVIEPVVPAFDPVMATYPNLDKWPDNCGKPPTRTHILMARALGIGKAGTKRELAVAAYLRDDAAQYNTSLVAAALQVVLGGVFNPLLNVVNRELCGSMGLAQCVKSRAPNGGTAYKLHLNARGEALVKAFMG